MKIIVTGAGGLVGRAAVSYCEDLVTTSVPLMHADLDIVDRKSVKQVIADYQPDAIVNCAAYTDVDGAESNADICDAVNNLAVGYLAGAAVRHEMWSS